VARNHAQAIDVSIGERKLKDALAILCGAGQRRKRRQRSQRRMQIDSVRLIKAGSNFDPSGSRGRSRSRSRSQNHCHCRSNSIGARSECPCN